MSRFLLCSTDESTFNTYIVGEFPVVGIASRFVIPEDAFIYDKTMTPEMPDDILEEELAELGIELRAII